MDGGTPCVDPSSDSDIISRSTFISSVSTLSALCLCLLLFIYHLGRRQARINVGKDRDNLKLTRKYNDLKNWNKYLAENLKRQAMAVDDLNAMEEAMEELKRRGKKDELSEVIIDSHDVMVKGLLGKGGNGEVHIAAYKNDEVALKRITQVRTPTFCEGGGERRPNLPAVYKQIQGQLPHPSLPSPHTPTPQIDADSIQRFRFECFIMKDLRHPNIVRLIGVCWDDFMMGCCLEYVDNHTLEFWLREEAKKKAAIAENDYEGNGPTSKHLREQSQNQTVLPFTEACFRGWKHPPNSDYREEDLKLISRCSGIISEAYEWCQKANLERRNSIVIPKPLPSYETLASPSSTPARKSSNISVSPLAGARKGSNGSSRRRGSIAQVLGLVSSPSIMPESPFGGWVRADVGEDLETIADVLPNYR